MTKGITRIGLDATALIAQAWDAVRARFERFCLTAGVATLARMLEQDATQLCGATTSGRPKCLSSIIQQAGSDRISGVRWS
jgi:hypothetical protein